MVGLCVVAAPIRKAASLQEVASYVGIVPSRLPGVVPRKDLLFQLALVHGLEALVQLGPPPDRPGFARCARDAPVQGVGARTSRIDWAMFSNPNL